VVTVEPATVIVPVGGTFDIAIKIADVENLFGFDVRMSWNPSIVKYVSHTVTVPVESYPDGVLYRPIYLVKDEANESGTPTDPESLLLVAYLSLPSAPSFNGSGTMLAVSFEVVGTGTCELALTNVDLTTPDARVIMREVQSGYFESSTSDHDVAVFLDVPKHVWPRTMIGINATVVNAGATAETDIMFQLMINSELVDMAFVPLDSAERHVLSYLWMPINEAFHNVTAYAIPVIDETYLDNNVKKIDVLVAEHIKVPAHFPSIQMAIDVASPGATVRVSEGTYREYLVINKRIALIGEGEMTVVDAMGTAYAIEVNEGDSRVEGFSIMNGTRCGIFVTRAENVDIFHNIIKEMPKCYAVFLTHSNNVNIKSNTMTEVREGISLDSSQNNILMWNNITGAKMAGISLSNSDHNYILANELRCCNTGVAVGLITTQQAAYNNTVKRNEISECGTGIAIHRGTGNTIIQNRISRNEWGVLLVDTTNNRIYHNNFIANTIQAEACLGNIWQSSDNQGNYWDDYTGEDLDGDGVGDTLIPHQGVDSYPLVDPWNALNADLTVDDRVDLFDLEFVASAYGVADCDPKWFPQADLAPQWGRIDILDAVTAAYYYSEQP
jgi:nitrous oxidase accessory protein